MQGQISSLLSFQFHSALVALTLTLLLYRSSPVVHSLKAEKRPQLCAELKAILRKKDQKDNRRTPIIYICI